MVWRFRNKFNGAVMECNDLNFLLHELIEVKGLNIPTEAGVDLMLYGKSDFKLVDANGFEFEARLEKVGLLKSSFFVVNPVYA